MSDNAAELEFKVAQDNGSFANIVGLSEVIESMYPAGLKDVRKIYEGDYVTDSNAVAIMPANSALRFSVLSKGETAIFGSTVNRGCPVGEDCARECALIGAQLSVAEMVEINCARANTAQSFEFIGQEPNGRFVLLPTSKDSYVVDETSLTTEFNGDELMQSRLKSATAVVFTKSWLDKVGLSEITVGMNGADGSMGVLTTKIGEETLLIPFCSMRQNMGDRAPEDQILRQALNAFFDSSGYGDLEREAALHAMEVSITLGASASLKNFAHKIKVPGEGPNVSEKEQADADRLREQYSELVEQAGGKITSAIVLNDQYPGAMGRGSIFPELEAKMGIHESPITPDNCPGDGQTCHINYRAETKYALIKQLKDMGVPQDSIHYDDSQALDPSSPDNNMASNRAEQNNGVPVPQTNRTLNALNISL